jgi:hypothetical protein
MVSVGIAAASTTSTADVRLGMHLRSVAAAASEDIGIYAGAHHRRFTGATAARLARIDPSLKGAVALHQLHVTVRPHSYTVSATGVGFMFGLSGGPDASNGNVTTFCSPAVEPLCLPTAVWATQPFYPLVLTLDEAARTAQTTMEIYATQHNGYYSGATAQKLARIEPSLRPLARAKQLTVKAGPDWYKVTVAEHRRRVTIRTRGGYSHRTCGPPGAAGCQYNGTW